MNTADLLARTRADQLHEHPALNLLAAATDASQTTITLTKQLGMIGEGGRISIELEDMRVWDTSGQTVSVLRGAEGTTAATHDEGDTVYVNARFSDAQILRAVNAELASLPAEGLWRPGTLELTASAVERSYNLTGLDSVDLLGLHEVRVDTTDPSNDWPKVPAYIDWDAETDDFASGLALILREDVEPGRPLRVVYRQGFAALTTLAQDVEAITGLWDEAHDILQIGAAARLMAGTEITRSRTSSQGDIRRAGEVPPGTNLQASRGLLALRERRIAEERKRMSRKRPLTLGVR